MLGTDGESGVNWFSGPNCSNKCICYKNTYMHSVLWRYDNSKILRDRLHVKSLRSREFSLMDDESEKMNEESAVISVCGYLYDVLLVTSWAHMFSGDQVR